MDHLVHTDFLVLGGGIAGLSFALKVADHGSVALITKETLECSNTSYAQGGIAAVTRDNDSYHSHIEDTLIAGAGLCHRDAVERVAYEAPERIQDLINWGVPFTRDHDHVDDYDLAREGGHSHHRILHVDDLTGKAIQDTLIERVKEHPNINVFEYHHAIELITEHHAVGNLQAAFNICFGAYVMDVESSSIRTFHARYTMLATGGASKVYLHSTNPDIATGDGVAMAFRAGVRCANMEFVQFHPTSLYNPGGTTFLISEALRGFGGILINRAGERFMPGYDDRAELAPRDVVSRSIDAEMKKRREECMYLDMTSFDADVLRERFPNIYKNCKKMLGLDITTSPIPVVPAAHYVCGGVMTSLTGQTSMQNLYASGEVAHTGVHGANRLASNSLVEALVFSHNAAQKVIGKRTRNFGNVIIPEWDETGVLDKSEWFLIRHNFKEIQNLMWDYVGIIRSQQQLKRALRRMRVIFEEVEDYYKRSKLTKELLELRNVSAIAYMIITAAIRRNESRGLHYMSDFPEKNDRYLKDTII